MIRERRSLWTSISTSKKVNALSLQAALLYTFAISHFDDEGFMDGDPRIIKSQIVPLRDDIPVEIIAHLIAEISTIHEKVGAEIPLWVIHNSSTELYLQDPVFNERQSFKGIHKIPSKIKMIVEKVKKQRKNTPSGAEGEIEGSGSITLGSAEGVHKLSEVKLSEVKGREGKYEGKGSETDSLSFFEKKEKLKEQAKSLGVT